MTKAETSYKLIFYALSRFGNLHSLGNIITKNVDNGIKEGKEKFLKHLRKNDNLRVYVCDEYGDTLADFTYERI